MAPIRRDTVKENVVRMEPEVRRVQYDDYQKGSKSNVLTRETQVKSSTNSYKPKEYTNVYRPQEYKSSNFVGNAQPMQSSTAVRRAEYNSVPQNNNSTVSKPSNSNILTNTYNLPSSRKIGNTSNEVRRVYQ